MHLRAVNRRAASLLLGLAAMVGPSFQARGETAAVMVKVRGGAARPAKGVVTAKAMDGRTAPLEVPFACSGDAPCSVRLDLPDRQSWVVSASARGFWASPAIVSPGGMVELWPTGKLRGEVGVAQGGPSPVEIGAKFSPSPSPGVPDGFPEEGHVVCPVVERGFECEIPAGALDLRLRAKGHVSSYRWAQKLAPGSVLDLGRLELRRGASLVGRVVSSDRDAPKPGACVVRVEGASRPDPKKDASAGLPKTTVDTRGFFHLEVVPAGSWVLVAEQEGFAAARRAVNVLEGMEANLNEPLVLARPARLELTLLPPQDPDGKPWMVELLEVRGEGRIETVATAPASLAGFWSKDRLSSGHELMARVRTSGGQAWWADTSAFEVAGPVQKRTLDLGLEEVRGSVHLGDQPLAGRVAFGAPEENISIALRTGPDGLLSGVLPRLGKWRVVVTSEMPSVRRELDVELQRGPDGRGRVEIALQDRALVGEIVDENGKRLQRAILTITATAASKRESAQEHVEAGAFRLTGFEPGGYLLRAEGASHISETIAAEIAPDGSSPFLTVVARPKAAVNLRLVNESGSPVPAANVRILQTTASLGISTISRQTDAMGRVTFSTHPGVAQQCFAVTSPGLSTRIFAMAPGPDEQQVVVPAAGGTISIERPAPREGAAVLLWQGPCFVSAGLLKMIAGGDGTKFPGMAPGEYRLCLHAIGSPADASSCMRGFLDRYGFLSLKISATAP